MGTIFTLLKRDITAELTVGPDTGIADYTSHQCVTLEMTLKMLLFSCCFQHTQTLNLPKCQFILAISIQLSVKYDIIKGEHLGSL